LEHIGARPRFNSAEDLWPVFGTRPFSFLPPCTSSWTACFLRDAADNGLVCQKEAFRASAALDWFRLRPYSALALFCGAVLILEPAKPLAGYLLGTGHFFAGAVTFITAEVLKLTLVERLFLLNRQKLLSIPAFAWGYRYWRHMMDVVEALEVWKASQRFAGMLRTLWFQFKHSYNLATRHW